MSTTELSPEAQKQEAPASDTASILAAARAKSGSKDKPVPKKKGFLDKAWNESLKLIRRVHLYSGIFMLPWVLLYGFTGWFFNHPGYFTGDQVTTFNAADVADGQLAALPKPDAMASQIVDELNIESFLVDGPEIKLTDTRPAEFTGFLKFSVFADGAQHNIEIDPVTGHGEVRTTFANENQEPTDAPPSNPLQDIRGVNLNDNALAKAQDATPQVLSDLGLSSGEASPGRRSANLMFSADVDGVPCVVTCNLGNGSITALREDSKPEMETKSFLQRLHLARMYSPHWNVRWFWALMVDAMFLSMVFWGISGILMWWQIKRTRLWGGGFLVASVICAVLLMVGMHDSLSTSGRGRGGGGGGGGGGRPAAAQVEVEADEAPADEVAAAR
ncbi:PepSY domain-containing protein [Bremerella sp. T1]|uniref:PepSY domain-containing protein n=1 Tax=Bremerella sp. TYQ1 TaxID=3119568 RepID=UPI001CCC9881|nr:PepSY domain-containing protein [Bremerella volcania]UBM36815.1 PepSY domain-containing protein [Bremerella volcania]